MPTNPTSDTLSTKMIPEIRAHLLDVLIKRFDEGNWHRVSADLPIEGGWNFLPGPDKRVSFMEYVDKRRIFPDLFKWIESNRPDIFGSLSNDSDFSSFISQSRSRPEFHISFVNRDYEINSIVYPTAPAYRLVIGPAGYGKTELLKELKNRFDADKWSSYYIDTDLHPSLDRIVGALYKEQSIGTQVQAVQKAKELGQNFGGSLAQAMAGNPTKVVLLIDMGNVPKTNLLTDLIEGFVPGIQEELYSNLGFFKTNHNAFRVVIACRYSPGLIKLAKQNHFTPLLLGTFDYDVIRKSLQSYLGTAQYTDDYVLQLASHLLNYTGGHPGCIAQILKIHDEKGRPYPDRFFLRDEESIALLGSIIGQTIETTLHGIDPELGETLMELSIYREMDTFIFKSLLDRKIINHSTSPIDLEDALTETYLISRKGYLLHDDITRRLLKIRFSNYVSPKTFEKHCELAKTLYLEHLSDPKCQTPFVWTIEYLYQCLQLCTDNSRTKESIETRRKSFFQNEVPTALGLLAKGRNWKNEQKALQQAILEDWEFEFVINYFLCEGVFNQSPSKLLQEKIAYFNPPQENEDQRTE